MVKYYIRVDGDYIIDFVEESNPKVIPSGWYALIEVDDILNGDSKIQYKYVNDQPVLMTQEEIDLDPIKKQNDEIILYQDYLSFGSEKLVLEATISNSNTPEKLKNRAQSRLTKVNQKLLEIINEFK